MLPSGAELVMSRSPRSASLVFALDGLMIPPSPLASATTISEVAGRLPAAQETEIVDPGVAPSTAAEFAGVVALL